MNNFAEQWLYLRNLESTTPDMRLFPDFDDNLRQAFRQETELFFESIMREDRSVLDLLSANYTFPERAAGEALRHSERLWQPLPPRRLSPRTASRGGLLRQGSILTVTSYATRTSPVIRGKWILDNILGVPPPPPPPNVSRRSRRTADRQDAARCASGWRSIAPIRPARAAIKLMDPVGFSLENYDAVGRWRTAKTASRSMPPAAFPTAASSTASRDCKRRC